MKGRGRGAAPIGAALGALVLLWLPVLVHDLFGRMSPAQILASPVLRRAASAELLAMSVFAAAVAASCLLGLRSIGSGATRLAGWATASVASGLLAAVPAGLDSLKIFAAIDPPLRFLAFAALAALLARLLTLARSTTAIHLALGLAGLVGWVSLLASLEGPTAPLRWPVTVAATGALLAGIAHASGRGGRSLIASAWALGLLAALWSVAVETPRARRDLAPPAQPARASADRPNILVFVVDTLRLDYTAAGAEPGRTGVLGSELRAGHTRTTVLEAATSAASSTVPSVKSLITSRPPSSWGFSGAASDPPPEGVPTLAASLLAAGYETAAVTGNPLIQGGAFESGYTYFWAAGGLHFFQGSLLLQNVLALGDYWETLELVSRFGIHKLDGETVLSVADRWLGDRRQDRPFFLYLHIVEPHWPYDASRSSSRTELPGPPLDHVDLLRLPKGFPRNGVIRGTGLLRELEERYAGGVRHAGDLVDRALEMLRHHDADDDTLVVVLADHGEEFFEHDGFSHGHDVFEEQTAVPFVLLWPPGWPDWQPVRESTTPVSLLDLWPTLADLVDLPAPREQLAGRSLVPLLKGKDGEAPPPPVMSEAFYGPFWRMSFRQGRFKVRLTFNTQVSPLDTAAVEVFDLTTDPGEESPLRSTDENLRDLVARARTAAAARWSRRSQDGLAEPAADDAELEQLRALGYIQ